MTYTKIRHSLAILVSILLTLCLSCTLAFASSRKLVSKSVSGSFWTLNMLKYSFTATAGITYNGNTIIQQSDLSFSAIKCWSDSTAALGTISPRQSRKYLSNGNAVYVVTVRRNAQGFYQDDIDYTLTYRASDPGNPYSIEHGKTEESILILVDVDVGEPYNVKYFE